VNVAFFVSGDDYSYFTAPPTISVTVNRRNIQIVWSSDVELNGFSLGLEKKYLVWATANYVGSSETVTVTPVSPYFIFSPATLTFTSSTLQILFKATVTGAVGFTEIDYIIGGEAGGYYTSIAPQEVFTGIRSLGITSAVLSYDNQETGVTVTQPSVAALANNNVYSITLTSTVVPDSKLTITPQSLHVNFDPASIDLTPSGRSFTLVPKTLNNANNQVVLVPSYFVTATFTTTPKSAGIHDVYFVLSGEDGPFYNIPPHVLLGFNTFQSSSSHVGASLVLGLLASITLLLV